MKLWYDKTAAEWTEALPLGNGFMGAMVYGGVSGRFDLSENTCWSGGKQEKYIADDAGGLMEKARKLLIEGNYGEAEALMCKCNGLKINYGTQVPLQRLFVTAEATEGEIIRELDLISGISNEKFSAGKTVISRTSFISHEYNALCFRMTGDNHCLPDITIRTENYDNIQETTIKGARIIIRGSARDTLHSDGKTGVDYVIMAEPVTDGIINRARDALTVSGAKYIELRLTVRTSMFCTDYEAQCEKLLETALASGFEEIMGVHVKSHSAQMNACTLSLAKNTNSGETTDKRRLAYKSDRTDADLAALYFGYGRYLLLNSSRADSDLPAALQGGWNDNRACKMGWTDDMHLDINTQMNYYPAETTGLSDTSLPLFRWIKNILIPNGKEIAKSLYNAEGWCAHTVSNAFGWAAPGWEGVGWAFHISGGGWIASHIYEHYLFTGDRDFLAEYYEVLYESARFLSSVLMENADGELVTVPSYSPENVFSSNGKNYNITAGATVDIAVTKYIFDAVIKSAEILGRGDDFVERIKGELLRLPPFKTGRHGQLMEWNIDYDEPLPDHRHMSHLLSLHPFNLISPEKTPLLASAAKKSIERRLAGEPNDIVWANWAGALLILFSARLLDGKSAGTFINPMITSLSRDNCMITHDNGIYELDGNTGFTAGVAEMLFQSYDGEINLLPALPDEWNEGSMTGFVAYGGHVAESICWSKNEVKCRIKANTETTLCVRYGDKKQYRDVKKGGTYTFVF